MAAPVETLSQMTHALEPYGRIVALPALRTDPKPVRQLWPHILRPFLAFPASSPRRSLTSS